jgi:hypothetical protein
MSRVHKVLAKFERHMKIYAPDYLERIATYEVLIFTLMLVDDKVIDRIEQWMADRPIEYIGDRPAGK